MATMTLLHMYLHPVTHSMQLFHIKGQVLNLNNSTHKNLFSFFWLKIIRH
uniref:Uncharacterized protein n=1 Tax=Arundo donax TaxID=35708 RepID=A0A0A8YQW7_ARUDO